MAIHVLYTPYAAVNCSSLEPPMNGAVDLTEGLSLGATATYSCTLGYRLIEGDEQRTCRPDAVWSGTEPTCERTSYCRMVINSI